MGNSLLCCNSHENETDLRRQSLHRPIYYFKILLVGDRNVGKTCLMNRMTANESQTISPTMGVNFARKSMLIDEYMVKFHFWDPSGDPRFRSILPNYFQGINSVLFLYDITDEKSFVSLVEDWFPRIRANARPKPTLTTIVGNKSDLSSERAISVSKAIQLANRTDSLFMEVSAKSGHNVDNLLFIVGQQLIAVQQQMSDNY